MRILRIKLHNFRSYELFTADLCERGTVIIGPNGTGKTNLLEAVYVMMRGASFRASLNDCMKFGENQTSLLLETEKETRRLQLIRDDERVAKTFTINDQKSKILSRKHRLPLVLFEPNELRLISSSPTRRRDFLDGLIARLDPNYDRTIRAFQRALLQRNELLKVHHQNETSWQDHLFAWDIKFVQLAKLVTEKRATFLYNYQADIAELYTKLAGKDTAINIAYLSNISLENYDQHLLDKLQRSRQLEIASGHTCCGPQREDFLISLHNQPAVKVASRGEMRTIMLAFKLLELKLQTKISQTKPVILMDDVFSELDSTREKLLQETIQDHQFIITSTDARHKIKGCKIIQTK